MELEGLFNVAPRPNSTSSVVLDKKGEKPTPWFNDTIERSDPDQLAVKVGKLLERSNRMAWPLVESYHEVSPDLLIEKHGVLALAPARSLSNVEAAALLVSVTAISNPRHVVPALFQVCWCVNAAVASVPTLTVSAPVMVPPALSSLAAKAALRAALEIPELEKALNEGFIISPRCKRLPR